MGIIEIIALALLGILILLFFYYVPFYFGFQQKLQAFTYHCCNYFNAHQKSSASHHRSLHD